MNCRHCEKHLVHTFRPWFAHKHHLSGISPNRRTLSIKVKVCDECWLVQTEDYTQPDELFIRVMPTSPVHTSWLAMPKIMPRKMTSLCSKYQKPSHRGGIK